MDKIERTTGKLRVNAILFTARPYTRHSLNCSYRDQGPDYAGCACWRSILTYDGSTKRSHKVAVKVRAWKRAEQEAEKWLDRFDPTKKEQAKQEAAAKTIEAAVTLYLAAKVNGTFGRKCKTGTIRHAKTLLGDGTPEFKGKLGEWLDTLPFRPTLIRDITPEHVVAFRTSWTTYNDVSKHVMWTTLKNFFKFTRIMKWVDEDPARDLPHVTLESGNRTAHFSDEAYERIKAKAFESENPKLLPLLELMRHSGMALEDAVRFRTDSITGDVLSYKRAKTGKEAVVVLPAHVIELLATVAGDQPFLDTTVQLDSAKGDWRRKLQALFADAGYETVRIKLDKGTEYERATGPHMLRDTFAVDMITRPGMTTRDVAKMLGDTEKVVEKHYLPFAEKLRAHHVEKMRAALTEAR